MATDFTNLYNAFYSSFLTTANSLPINSLWVVKISDIPTYNSTVKTKEVWDIEKTSSKAETVNSNTKGLIIATGVKVVGDSIDVVRDGIKNTGHIQGLIGNGRTAFPLLNVAFVENNVSFVDYVLRPWQVAVAYNSLKDQTLKTTLDVWFLAKTGPNNPLVERKHVKYYGCCPVSIDEQEYNYSGSDMYKIRTVQFAYSYYELTDANDDLLDLIGAGGLSGLFSTLKNELQRQFGQYSIDNLVSKATTLGQSLLTGTAKGIVTNVAGSISGKINDAIGGITSGILNAGNGIVSNITDKTNAAINGSKNKSGGVSTNSVNKAVGASVDIAKRDSAVGKSTAKYQERYINTDDHTTNVQTIEQQIQNKPAEVSVNTSVNQNDYVSGLSNLSVTEKPLGDPNADVVLSNTKLKYKLVKTNQNDYVKTNTDISYIVRSTNQNDVVK
jgi:hypothetical protein